MKWELNTNTVNIQEGITGQFGDMIYLCLRHYYLSKRLFISENSVQERSE